jgi:hypothetical protein
MASFTQKYEETNGYIDLLEPYAVVEDYRQL